ncbi:MAG: hypothetical protein QGH62_01825 [Nitrospinaceae bacterium]|nr:hypothetical protein [Nitrospinaceae bacterium]MDP7611162.1 hypothetical protein [Nitrospinaceae bacterium]
MSSHHNIVCCLSAPLFLRVFRFLPVSDESNKDQKKQSWWKRLSFWWGSKEETEQKRLKSFIPLALYTAAFIYFVLYLSILNTVHRGKGMDAVKSWYGGDRPEIVRALTREKEGLENSFNKLIRKQVSGGR